MADPEQSLDAVLGTLLTALTGAQDQSNRLSRSLALDYRDDALLRRFTVPVGTLEDAEFDIPFAIEGVRDAAPPPTASRAAVSGPAAPGPADGSGTADPGGDSRTDPGVDPGIDPGAAVRAALGLVARTLRDMADHAPGRRPGPTRRTG